MTDRPHFETQLEERLRARAGLASRPFDAAAIARQAVTVSARRRFGGLGWLSTRRPNLGWLVVALLLAIALLGVVAGIGALLREGPSVVTSRWIVFVRDGDLFVADIDGSGQSLIASGDAGDAKLGYLTAAWSPDMRHIAAVRDVGGAFLTPGVDLMTADGALVRTVALDPGCGPSVSWSPDSSEVAIATCPADVPRDAIEPVDSGIGLLIAGLDASADREIALPPEWGSVASARRSRSGSDRNCGHSGLPTVGGSRFRRASPEHIGGWYLVAADGSGTRQIEEFTNGLLRVGFGDWSPDGRSLAVSGDWIGCVDGNCLGIVSSEGGPVSTVAYLSGGDPNTHEKLSWPEFSPDGDRVAVLGSSDRLHLGTRGHRDEHALRLRPGDRPLHGADIRDQVADPGRDRRGSAHGRGDRRDRGIGARSPGRRTVEGCCTSFVRLVTLQRAGRSVRSMPPAEASRPFSSEACSRSTSGGQNRKGP